MKLAYAIIGMQYGSEAKGALAGYLALQNKPDICVSNWSPNAGHTFRHGDFKMVRRMLPIGSISPSCHALLLGPGSVIDIECLAEESETVIQNIIIHPAAAIVNQHHETMEKLSMGDGRSTKKGVGSALANRITRLPPYNTASSYKTDLEKRVMNCSVDADLYNSILDSADVIQVEGCQGFSLSMYHGFYPYTTSRDCSIHQLKADIGWSNNRRLQVYGAVRPYPIRIADDSGPVYPDQVELSWEDIGVEPEITTVTKKVRRVFSFSKQQLRDSCRINYPDALYLSFCDYLNEEEEKSILEFLTEELRVPVMWSSNGPFFADMSQVGPNYRV